MINTTALPANINLGLHPRWFIDDKEENISTKPINEADFFGRQTLADCIKKTALNEGDSIWNSFFLVNRYKELHNLKECLLFEMLNCEENIPMTSFDFEFQTNEDTECCYRTLALQAQTEVLAESYRNTPQESISCVVSSVSEDISNNASISTTLRPLSAGLHIWLESENNSDDSSN